MDTTDIVNRLKYQRTNAVLCNEAANVIEHLQRLINEYEDTIRYLTLQVGKTL